MPPSPEPQVYHIVDIDRLRSIIADGTLLSDAAFDFCRSQLSASRKQVAISGAESSPQSWYSMPEMKEK